MGEGGGGGGGGVGDDQLKKNLHLGRGQGRGGGVGDDQLKKNLQHRKWLKPLRRDSKKWLVVF